MMSGGAPNPSPSNPSNVIRVKRISKSAGFTLIKASAVRSFEPPRVSRKDVQRGEEGSEYVP